MLYAYRRLYKEAVPTMVYVEMLNATINYCIDMGLSNRKTRPTHRFQIILTEMLHLLNGILYSQRS